jgi:peptidoglycan/xylan/chitin deacetylase (PgdA/CDA1 family)
MKVTLTFDNGPVPGITEAVLDVLAERSLKASFFVVGRRLQKQDGAALAARAHAEGHWIGNHTMTHTQVLGASDDPALPCEEIARAQDLIGGLAHPHRFFRPYGKGGIIDKNILSRTAVDFLCAGGYTCVLWNSVPGDWMDAEGWVERCLADVATRDHSVVVLHDVPGGAMDHLPAFLDGLADRGAELVQDFPASCLPIRCGAPTTDLGHLMN